MTCPGGSVFVQAAAEAGRGLEFLELRVGELEVARHGAKDRPLRLAANARHRFADIDRGPYAQFDLVLDGDLPVLTRAEQRIDRRQMPFEPDVDDAAAHRDDRAERRAIWSSRRRRRLHAE